jgi:drug/metabolite transporter (DMT)-like permease
MNSNSTLDRPLKAIGLMLLATSIVPFMDAIAKHLTQTYPVTEVVWARYFFHVLFLAPLILWRLGPRAFFPDRIVLQIVRGGFLLTSTIFFFGALAKIPITDTLAVAFIAPLIVTALSPIVLGEHVGLRRWIAVCLGFTGMLVVMRPGLAVFQPASLLAAGAGVTYAAYFLLTRKLSGTAPPIVTLAFTALLGMVVMSIWVAPRFVVPASSFDWLLMVCVGLIAAIGHYILIRAMEMASASLLAPFSYNELIGATILGFFVFGDFPDLWTWVGLFIVIGSGLYISLRERQISRRTSAADITRFR